MGLADEFRRSRMSVNARTSWLAGLAAVAAANERPGEPIGEDEARALRRLGIRDAFDEDLQKLMIEQNERGLALSGFWVSVTEARETGIANGQPWWRPAGVVVEDQGWPHKEPMVWAPRDAEELGALKAEAGAFWEREALARAAGGAAPLAKRPGL